MSFWGITGTRELENARGCKIKGKFKLKVKQIQRGQN
jgi:hypothetical protein